MVQKTGLDEFMVLAEKYPVLDVRSPGEYGHAHIPGAYSLPLFTDEERKVVGTAYKQQSREDAIKMGLDYFGVKMRGMVEAAESIAAQHAGNGPGENTEQRILVHCWRGGMRSAGVAWLLDLYGFKVYTLSGGYKAFRNWVLHSMEAPYPLQVVGGYTGSGKTDVLKQLGLRGCRIIDLEGIARHKGSAFGALGELPQPTQEMFENVLAMALKKSGGDATVPVWIEDESQRIGLVNIPPAFWNTMRAAPVFFLDIPFEERLNYITLNYGKYNREDLAAAIIRIQKRLGGQNTRDALALLLEDNYKDSFRILLRYYDKYYLKGLNEHKGQVHTIKCEGVNAIENSKALQEQKATA